MLRTSLTRSVGASIRHYSTPAGSTPKKSNVGLYLTGASIAAASAGYYLFNSQSAATTAAAVAPKQDKSPLDPKNFVDFKLKKVIPYNHNTSTFVFELPDNQASMLPVASCVLVKSSDPEALKDDKGKPIIRPYTPTSRPDLPGELHFLIKRYDNGNASKHIHSLKVGDNLGIKGPNPKFPYQLNHRAKRLPIVNQFEEVALIGGGSGITPLYQILDYALPDKNNKTKFKLIFANVTEKDILLRERFDEFKKNYPDKFDVVYVIEKGDKSWKGDLGYVTKDMIKKHVAPASQGPPPQVAAVAGKKAGFEQGELGGILKELGYSSDQVFKF